ncbi:MAG: bifunctional riboflavin kinase/FAD synthetase [Rhodocyclaceae bacterium]|jgi:riboflavin kinase/FMN adenylyltransferase|nr:bifunctional riboflavin kinase/FAD synthetase [Rhodocyclaceae bacterium]
MRFFLGVPPQAIGPTTLTIGNFDGVHLGHRAMLDALKKKAVEQGLPVAVLTFEPHPRELFAPDQAPPRLTSLREKLELLKDAGVDFVYLYHFTRKSSSLSAEEFIAEILVKGLSVRHLIVGDDFRFGKGRSGDFALLAANGARHGFTVEALPTISLDDVRVSSSAVRDALLADDLDLAARLLGRPYSIAGRVVHGDKIGRVLGFHTANVQLKRKRLPLSGVFAVRVSGLDGERLHGVANIGVRPTLTAGMKPVLEVHLLDFGCDIYGAHLDVHFLHKIRNEQRFESREALQAQIAADVEATRTYFAGNKNG